MFIAVVVYNIDPPYSPQTLRSLQQSGCITLFSMCDAAHELYEVVDEAKKKYECKLCGHTISGIHLRRLIYHFIPMESDGSTKCCPKRKEVAAVSLKIMENYLQKLNDEKNRRKEKRKRVNDSSSLKFQSKLKVKVKTENFSKKEMDLAFARMVVMSTCRSGFLDSYFTQHFFEKYLFYSPPSRRTVYRSLLDELYQDTKSKVLAKLNLKDPDSLLTLTMDAWNAPNGDHIRNYCVVTDGGLDFMLCADDLGSTSQTATQIADSCLAVMEKFGAENFCAVVTDNAANETTSWDGITKKYPDILCTGCACHAASLLYKDIFEHQWAKKIFNESLLLAKFIKSHTWTNCELKRRTKEQGQQKSIILHAATRFAGSYYMMGRLLEVKGVIRTMVVSDEFEAKKYDNQSEIQRLVQRKSFWDDLSTCVKFMRPLKNFIKLMDHSQHTTHLVYSGLLQLDEIWGDKDTGLRRTVPPPFYRHVNTHFKSRVRFMSFPVHHITYALSPEHHRDNIWALRDVVQGTKQIMRTFLHSNEMSVALEELEAFKKHKCTEMFPDDPKNAIKNPKTWWKVHGCNWPTLQTVALRVFSIGTATAPSERNFSAFGNIWNLRSYSLSAKNAFKLVYVYYNLRKLHTQEIEKQEGIDYGWLQALNDSDLCNGDEESSDDEVAVVDNPD